MPSPPPYSPHNPQLSPSASAALAAPPPPHLAADLQSRTSSAMPAEQTDSAAGVLPSPSTSGSGGTTPTFGAAAGAGTEPANGGRQSSGRGRPDLKGKRKASEANSNVGEDAAAGEGKEGKTKKKVKVGARASIACKTCRKRKVRCSAEWPICSFCSNRKMECVYEGHPAENGGTLLAGPSGIIPPNISALEAELPDPPILLEALEVFLMHYYDIFPFLHRATLIDEIKNGTAPRELVCCILALAARFSSTIRDTQPSPTSSAPDYYARLAAELLTLPENSPGHALPAADTPISLMRCQCFAILGFFEITAGRDNSGWLKLGNAIRMAQVLRLGFEDETPYMAELKPRAEDDAADPSVANSRALRSELRRRLFWALFALDRTISDGNERPCGLKVPRIASLRMPGGDTQFQAGQQSLGARFDPDPPAWSVSARPPPGGAEENEANLYGHMLRIAEIWSKVASYIGSGGRMVDRRPPWLDESQFAQLARELTEFEGRLPEELKYSEQTMLAHCMGSQTDARTFGMLHLLHAGSRHVLHRDYLPFLPPLDFKAANGPVDGEPLFGDSTSPPNWWQRNFDLAAASANVISDVCTQLSGHGITLTHPFAGFAAVAAGTVHCHLRFWPQSSAVPDDALHLHYFNQDVEILNGLRGVYPIADRWYENLAGLSVLYWNVSRGVFDADPIKVRAGLLQLMRSAREDADVPAAPRKPTPGKKNGVASRQPAVVAAAAANDAVPPLPAEHGPASGLRALVGESAPHERTLSQSLDALVPTPNVPGTPVGGLGAASAPPIAGTAYSDLLPPPLPGDLELPTDFFDLAALHGGLGGLGLATLDDAGYYWGGNSWGLGGFGGLGGAFPPPGAPPPGTGNGGGYGDLGWPM